MNAKIPTLLVLGLLGCDSSTLQTIDNDWFDVVSVQPNRTESWTYHLNQGQSSRPLVARLTGDCETAVTIDLGSFYYPTLWIDPDLDVTWDADAFSLRSQDSSLRTFEAAQLEVQSVSDDAIVLTLDGERICDDQACDPIETPGSLTITRGPVDHPGLASDGVDSPCTFP